MHVHASELKGANRCYQRRERNITLSDSKNDIYRIVGIQKAAIKNYFISKALSGKDDEVKRVYEEYIQKKVAYEDVPDEDKEMYRLVRTVLSGYDDLIYSYEPDEVVNIVNSSKMPGYIDNYITNEFTKLHFATIVTAEQQAEIAYKVVMRYLKFETRTPIFPEAKELNIFGVTVTVKPDFLFHNVDGSIEAVKLCCKRPDVTRNGRKKDTSKDYCMELYALWRYARDEIENDTDIVVVRSSYYFMKNDRDKKGEIADEFHLDGQGNIVSLEEQVTKHNKARLDIQFEPQFVEYIAGEECSGETCETCDFCKLCNYAKAPKSSKTEKTRKKVSDIDSNAAQEEAEFYRKGICRINAGAGAGKTLVVALRTAYMLSEGIRPEEIFLVTFTDAGAKEMRERIEMYDEDLETGTDMSKLYCMTFNAFGDMAIRQNYEKLGFEHEPKLIDDIQRKSIITHILNEHEVHGIDYRNFYMSSSFAHGALDVASHAFDLIKRERLSTYDVDTFKEYMAKDPSNGKSYESAIQDERAYGELLKLYDEFDETLRDKCLIEYADQERLLFDLLDIEPYYFDNFGFKHIIIDEYQDTSKNQMELVKKFVDCKSFESLMVVGDDSQSIYSFRNANPDNIINFFDILEIPEDERDDIYIMENHRSTPEILKFANDLNDKNYRKISKKLIPTREHGKKPVVKGFHTVKEEYDYIADIIKKKEEEGVAADDIAVIAYTRKELIQIQGVLSEHGLDTILQCPEPMLENSRVQGLISLCHMLKDSTATRDIAIYLNCVHDGSLLSATDKEINDEIERCQNRIAEFHRLPYGKKMDKFDEMAKEIVGEDEIAKNLYDRIQPFDKLSDKFDYIDTFVQFEGECVKRDGKYSGVVLTTAHSSKGLEYKIVINSITKYDKKMLHIDEQDERRRVFFVSATRARDELYITGQYKVGGNARDGYIYNRFISEAHDILHVPYDPVDHDAAARKKKATEKAAAKVLAGQVSAF